MSSYLKIIYNQEKRPITKYPSQLANLFFSRFNMKKGDTFLDIGCGRGDFLRGFKELGLGVFGIDSERSNSETLKDIDVKILDIEEAPFPFEKETFDFVFSKSVIEHLWNPDNFIKESYRVLKPGGRIIVMTPDWVSQRIIFYDDFTHVHPYTKTSIDDFLKIYNFKKVEAEIFYQLPILWKYSLLKKLSKVFQVLGPVKKIYKNKFIRWSRELMILGTGIK